MQIKHSAAVISGFLGLYSVYDTTTNETDRVVMRSLVQDPRMSDLVMETVDYMPKDLRQIYHQALAKKAEQLMGTAL